MSRSAKKDFLGRLSSLNEYRLCRMKENFDKFEKFSPDTVLKASMSPRGEYIIKNTKKDTRPLREKDMLIDGILESIANGCHPELIYSGYYRKAKNTVLNHEVFKTRLKIDKNTKKCLLLELNKYGMADSYKNLLDKFKEFRPDLSFKICKETPEITYSKMDFKVSNLTSNSDEFVNSEYTVYNVIQNIIKHRIAKNNSKDAPKLINPDKSEELREKLINHKIFDQT